MGLIKILIGSKAGKRIILVKAFEEPNDIAKLTVRVATCSMVTGLWCRLSTQRSVEQEKIV